MQSEMELLHRIRGSVDVARSMVARSADLCDLREGSAAVFAGLTEAADALAAVALTVDEELRKRASLGPAA